MNAAGFEPHCVDVTCVEKKSGYRYGTAISLELAQKAAAMAGVTLELDDDGDDLTYRIAEPKPEGKTESDDIISF
jgi:hypothetical protein